MLFKTQISSFSASTVSQLQIHHHDVSYTKQVVTSSLASDKYVIYDLFKSEFNSPTNFYIFGQSINFGNSSNTFNSYFVTGLVYKLSDDVIIILYNRRDGIDVIKPTGVFKIFQETTGSKIFFYRILCPQRFRFLGDIASKRRLVKIDDYRCISDDYVIKTTYDESNITFK